MRRPQKALLAIGFTLVLVLLGVTDAVMTKNTLVLPTEAGVAKKAGPDVPAIALRQAFTMSDTSEEFLLQKASKPGAAMTARVLLRDNDRAGALAWVDSPDVKTIFSTLKRQLRSSFSPELKDLIDETQSEPGQPPRDVLSFSDPAIHADRILIVRVRERLYEFHVTAGKEEAVDRLLNALTE